jgi:hypothetical protein
MSSSTVWVAEFLETVAPRLYISAKAGSAGNEIGFLPIIKPLYSGRSGWTSSTTGAAPDFFALLIIWIALSIPPEKVSKE